jgi:hypothetical protein
VESYLVSHATLLGLLGLLGTWVLTGLGWYASTVRKDVRLERLEELMAKEVEEREEADKEIREEVRSRDHACSALQKEHSAHMAEWGEYRLRTHELTTTLIARMDRVQKTDERSNDMLHTITGALSASNGKAIRLPKRDDE